MKQKQQNPSGEKSSTGKLACGPGTLVYLDYLTGLLKGVVQEVFEVECNPKPWLKVMVTSHNSKYYHHGEILEIADTSAVFPRKCVKIYHHPGHTGLRFIQDWEWTKDVH